MVISSWTHLGQYHGQQKEVIDMGNDMENVIQWLEKVRKLDELIDAKCAERDQLWALATKITPVVSDMPHGGGVTDKVGNISVKLAQLAEETNDLVDQYVDYKQMVIRELEKLPRKQYGAMHRYYIRYMTWEEVAEDMGVCSMTLWRWWQESLKNLADVVECYTIPVV
jgi:DNA-directed RNA polymerase specialized sigma24 family protein